MQARLLVFASHIGNSYNQWRVDIAAGHLLQPPLDINLGTEVLSLQGTMSVYPLQRQLRCLISSA